MIRTILETVVALALIAVTGCNSATKQQRIESRITSAIDHGQPAEDIEQLVQQADDPSHAAYVAASQVLHIESLPTRIRTYWDYFRPTPPSSTPSVEIFEVINRYKVSVLRVLVPQRITLSRLEDKRPLVIWGGWAHPPMTPELLTFLLENGYSTRRNADFGNPVALCGEPGQAFLRYDHKYEMLKTLLRHGADPDVMSMGQPILHQLITRHADNPHQLEMIQLLLDAGADANVVDTLGKTPLDAAIAYTGWRPDDPRGPKMVDLLKRYGAKTSADL